MKIVTFKIIKKLFILALLFNNVFPLRLKSENENENSNKLKNKNSNKNQNQNKLLTVTGLKEQEASGIAGQIYLKGTSEKLKKIQLSTSNSSSIKKEELKTSAKTNTNTKTKTNTYTKAKSSSLSSSLNKQSQYNDENSQLRGNTNTNYNSPILEELWVKYFKYTNSDLNIKTPRNFFVNSGYYQQGRLYPNLDYSKDKDLIKSKDYFYLSIFKNSLVFNSSKKVKKYKKKLKKI
jgi:hypothetical protein